MTDWIAPVRPVGRALAAATALGVLMVAAANAQAPKPPAAKPPATATKPPAATPPAAQPAPAPAAAAPANQQVELIYSPWTKICAKGPDDQVKQVCLTGKDARVETGQPVGAVVLIQPEGRANVLRVTLPITVALQRGARVMIDQKKLANAASDQVSAGYQFCIPTGCTAEFEATPEVITQLRSGKMVAVQGISVAGEFMNIPIPLDDFVKALDGPPTDPKVYAEQQKTMQEQLQKRAEEWRKKLEAQQAGAVQPGK